MRDKEGRGHEERGQGKERAQAGERGVVEQLKISVEKDGRSCDARGSLGYGLRRPYELLLGFDGRPTWIVDVSVAITGIHCTPASPAGIGDVQIWRHTGDCVAVALHGQEWTATVHYPASVFCEFVRQITELFEDPPPVADEVLASKIEEWSTDVS